MNSSTILSFVAPNINASVGALDAFNDAILAKRPTLTVTASLLRDDNGTTVLAPGSSNIQDHTGTFNRFEV